MSDQRIPFQQVPAQRAPRKRHRRVFKVLFLVIVAALLTVPSLGMLVAPTTSSPEKRDLTNFSWGDLGGWFDDHFALRNQLISANARLEAGALGTSSSDQVVCGKDGWLYYAGTLSDYVQTDPLSNADLKKIAENLKAFQDQCDAQGAAFAFMLAPDKASLYPEHMPYYYLRGTGASNASRLKPFLDAAGVTYVDLSALQLSYFKTDTHWNNVGALMAMQAATAKLGLHSSVVWPTSFTTRADHVGDLAQMLYPAGAAPEDDYYLKGVNDGPALTGADWRYRSSDPSPGEEAYEAGRIQTSGKGEAHLVVYRDSFGNAMLPYLASITKSAYFSKMTPYEPGLIAQTGADYVIVEKAERNLKDLVDPAFLGLGKKK
ncbi:MAG: hypothetical protein LBL67_02905 [Coriobacteriales bacterium]|nr:hypothetical protein [Coriobacteriales bacterium]